MSKISFLQYRHWLRAHLWLLETSHHLVILISNITITSAKFTVSCSIGCFKGFSGMKHNVIACRLFWVTAQPGHCLSLHTRILARLEGKACNLYLYAGNPPFYPNQCSTQVDCPAYKSRLRTLGRKVILSSMPLKCGWGIGYR